MYLEKCLGVGSVKIDFRLCDRPAAEAEESKAHRTVVPGASSLERAMLGTVPSEIGTSCSGFV